MIQPTRVDLGRKVIYTSPGGETREEGVITSYNDKAVFVRFGNDVTPKACSRNNLEWSIR